MLIQVQTITDSAIDLADMRNSQFIDQTGAPGTELMRYVNLAYKDLYQQIVLAKEFYFTLPYDFNLVGNVETYNLPTDFYKLDGVDCYLGSAGQYITLTPFMFKERNKYKNGYGVPALLGGQVYKYILYNNQIKFIPVPTDSSAIRLWYTPEPVTITMLNQNLAIPIGGDEYMSLYMAAAMLAKEESDTSAINGKRMEVLDQLKNSLKDRDAGSPSYIVDESTINAGAYFPFGNMFGGY